jgi:uncharacterized protein DUF4398
MNVAGFKSRSITIVLAVAAAGGCASRGTVPAQDDLTRVAASVKAAEQAGASEHGSTEMNLARQKLAAAERARDKGDDKLAQRLLVEADLDAELAVAKTAHHEMQAAVAELQESIRTLQQELRRNEQQTLGRL